MGRVPSRGRGVVAAAVVMAGLPAVARTESLALTVNTYTTGDQLCPSATPVADGSFVVVWDSAGSPGSDHSATSIQGRRLSSSGEPLGDQFQVNAYTLGFQINPDVASGRDGAFVVVWEAPAYNGPGADAVLGRRFSSSGAPIGGDFQVHNYTTDDQDSPSVAVNRSGAFLAVWSGDGTHDATGIHGRMFDSAGNTTPTDFEINIGTANYQGRPDVAAVDDGSFVVVWDSEVTTRTSDAQIRGRRVAAGGPIGSEFTVAATLGGNTRRPAVSSWGDGQLVSVWDRSPGIGDPDTGVAAVAFQASGEILGSEFALNTETLGPQVSPRIAAGPSARAIAAWLSSPDGIVLSIKARFVGAFAPLGPEIVLDETSTGIPSNPVAAWSRTGNIVVAWQTKDSPEDGSGFAIRATRIGDPFYIFSNGFEEGSTVSWTASFPDS